MLSGVPQRSVLGPVLFLIFINDLPDNIRSSVCLFADDCVLYRNIHSLQDCLALQEDLTSLGQWEADWQMKFNVAECHSIRVLTNSKFGLFYFNFLILTPSFSKVLIEKYGKTPNFSGKQHFYSYFQNPSENSVNESDSASASQTNSFRVLTTQLNFGKRSVGKIPWYHH